MPNITCSHKTLNLNNSSKKTILKKCFLFRTLCWTSFLMTSLTFLYNEYISIYSSFYSSIYNWLNKKHPFEYIVPPPTPPHNWGRNSNDWFVRKIKLSALSLLLSETITFAAWGYTRWTLLIGGISFFCFFWKICLKRQFLWLSFNFLELLPPFLDLSFWSFHFSEIRLDFREQSFHWNKINYFLCTAKRIMANPWTEQNI